MEYITRQTEVMSESNTVERELNKLMEMTLRLECELDMVVVNSKYSHY